MNKKTEYFSYLAGIKVGLESFVEQLENVANKNGNELPIEFVKLVSSTTISDVESKLFAMENGKELVDALNNRHIEKNESQIKCTLLNEYAAKYGVPNVINEYGEVRTTKTNSIIFPNGLVASIVENVSKPDKGKFSVAMCDYNGYFDWEKLNKFGAYKGKIFCNTELEIIIACEIIRKL